MNILLVCIDDVKSDICQHVLRSYNHHVIRASSSEEACSLSKKHGFDLVIVEEFSIDPTGLNVISEIRDSPNGESVAIVALLEEDSAYLVEHALKNGADDYVLMNELLSERFTCKLAVMEKVSSNRNSSQLVNKITHMARHDHLTGVANKRYLEEYASELIESNSPFGVMFIDINGFKQINDIFGHTIGDALLKRVAWDIQLSCTGDFIARYGGDEFVVICEEYNSEDDIVSLAKAISNMFADGVRIGELNLSISLSIGIAFHPEDGSSLDNLLVNTDHAMYAAKEDNTNVRLFDDDIRERVRLRNSVVLNLRKAIQDKDLYVVYQPQFHSETLDMIGVEALVRWKCNGQEIPPGDFIPMIENTDLIYELESYVIQSVFADCAEFRKQTGRNLVFTINISPKHFTKGDKLIREFEMGLVQHDVKAKWIGIELTENTLVHDMKITRYVLNELKELGCSIYIDDFGKGYSSLSYLKKLPISKLKIDRDFVKDLPYSGDDEVIVKAIIGLAHNLGISVVAEGMETEEQVNLLKSLGCDMYQGFYFSKPLTFKSLLGKFISGSKQDL